MWFDGPSLCGRSSACDCEVGEYADITEACDDSFTASKLDYSCLIELN